MKTFDELTEPEMIALAISNEEEDGRIFAEFAHSLRDEYPDAARMFSDMAVEEGEHRRQLIDQFAGRFGDHIPLIRRQDIRGNVARKRVWQRWPRKTGNSSCSTSPRCGSPIARSSERRL